MESLHRVTEHMSTLDFCDKDAIEEESPRGIIIVDEPHRHYSARRIVCENRAVPNSEKVDDSEDEPATYSTANHNITTVFKSGEDRCFDEPTYLDSLKLRPIDDVFDEAISGDSRLPIRTIVHADEEVGVADEFAILALLETVLFSPGCSTPPNMKTCQRMLLQISRSLLEAREDIFDLVVQEIYRAMESFRVDPVAQGRCCFVLGMMCQNSSTILAKVVETEGVPRVIDALNTHHSSEFLQNQAVFAIISFSADEAARSQLVNCRGAEGVAWAVGEFQHSSSIVVNGATALCNLASESDDTKKRIGKAGGINALVDAMGHHDADANVQAYCCLALRNLTYGVRANQWIAGRAFAMEAIVKAMSSFPEEKHLQKQGCIAIANMCADEPENKDRATNTGTFAVCITATRASVEDAQLMDHVLSALQKLCAGHSENQRLAGSCGGVLLVLSALQHHRGNESIVCKACNVLRYLCFELCNRQLLHDNGGLEPLIRVLRNSMEIASVANSVVLALSNAIFDHPSSKKAVGRYGGIAAIVDVMSNHLDKEGLQENGCRALRNLADSDELNSRLLGESGAVDAVIFAMMGYPQNADIQEQACAMLFNMAFSMPNLKIMKALEVDKLVQHALRFHSQNEAVQCQAEALVKRLNMEVKRSYTDVWASFASNASRKDLLRERRSVRTLQTPTRKISVDALRKRPYSTF